MFVGMFFKVVIPQTRSVPVWLDEEWMRTEDSKKVGTGINACRVKVHHIQLLMFPTVSFWAAIARHKAAKNCCADVDPVCLVFHEFMKPFNDETDFCQWKEIKTDNCGATFELARLFFLIFSTPFYLFVFLKQIHCTLVQNKTPKVNTIEEFIYFCLPSQKTRLCI